MTETPAFADPHRHATPKRVAEPVVFAGCAGFYHEALDETGRDVAVLLCSPWGYEDLCTRKSWRQLAEAIAAAGFPCLRFDYPGTGDALGDAGGIDDLKVWEDSVVDAATVLCARSGASRLVLLGQGLGATLALRTAGRLPRVEGLALLAPVVKGRAYLRELTAWAGMIASANGLAAEPEPAGGLSVAGFVMSPLLATSIKAVDLSQIEAAPAPKVLVLARQGRPQDQALADQCAALGSEVESSAYSGYDDLLSNPTLAKTPRGALDAVTNWLTASFPSKPHAQKGTAQRIPSEAALPAGDGFVEAPVRFGSGEALFGVLCRPEGVRRGRTVLMLNGGYDPHIGWARMSVEHARALAADGVASLRIDAANIGDSPPRADARDQVLYSDGQVDDVAAALDWLEARELTPVTVVGRCSGAYLALISAVQDPRIAEIVMVNPLRLVWDPAESVDEAIRFGSFGSYRAKALQPQTLKRILTGQVDVARLARRLAEQGLTSARSAALHRGRSDALHREAHRRFTVLRDRGVAVSLVFSDSEVEGVERLNRVFGKDGRGLAAYANVQRATIPNADHNVTPAAARDWLRAHVLERVLTPRRPQVGVAA